MQIVVIITGRHASYNIEADPMTTIIQLKQKIYEIVAEKHKIHPKRQKLIYSGKSLDDEKSLHEIGLKENVSLWIVERLICADDYDPNTLKVQVALHSPKEIHTFIIPLKATVEHLKEEIEKETGIVISKQRLMFKGRQVYSGPLSVLCSKDLAEILEFSLRTTWLLHIRLVSFTSVDSYDYHIPATAEVRKVREAIAKSEGFGNSMRLVYDEILDDNLTLGDYEAIETEIGRIGVMVQNVRAGRVGEAPEIFLIGGRRSVYLNQINFKDEEVASPPPTSCFACFTNCFQ